MSDPLYVYASQVRNGAGFPIAPTIGTVPTADGAGGATWQAVGGDITLASTGTGVSLVNHGTGPALEIKDLIAGTGVAFVSTGTDITVNNSSPASSVTLSNAAGGTGVTAITSGTGPALAIRRFLSSSNVLAALSGAGDILFSLATALTNILSIQGAANTLIDLSVANQILIGQSQPTAVYWYTQPRCRWNTPTGGTSFVSPVSGGVLNAYRVPPPGTPQGAVASGFSVDVNGLSTYDPSLPNRRMKITYSLTVDIAASASALAPRNLYFFPYVGVGTPPTSTTVNTGAIHLPGGPTTPAETYNITICDQLVMNPGDAVQLAVIFDGTFTVSPSFYSLSCTIEGMLSPS